MIRALTLVALASAFAAAAAPEATEPQSPAAEAPSMQAAEGPQHPDAKASPAVLGPSPEASPGSEGLAPLPSGTLPSGGAAVETADTPGLTEVDIIDLNQIKVEEASPPAGALDLHEDSGFEDLTHTIHIEEILEPPMDYHYAAFGRVNPFQSPALNVAGAFNKGGKMGDTEGEAQAAGAVSGSEIPIVNPLQGYAINDLEVKGIWQQGSGEWRAIVMTPRKEGIIVKVGDPISSGKVLLIDRNKLSARQYQIRTDGAREYHDEEMYLSPTLAPKVQGKVILRPGEEPEFLNPEAEADKKARDRAAELAAKAPPAASPTPQPAPSEAAKPQNTVIPAAAPAAAPQPPGSLGGAAKAP